MTSPAPTSRPLGPILKTLLFTVVLPGTFGVYLPYWFSTTGPPAPLFVADGWRWLGIPLMALGALGYFWCAWHFAVTGRGTPAPIDPPKVLVVQGLYRYVRNPMYVSVTSFVIGESLLWNARDVLLYVLAVFVGFNLFVLFVEEPTLRAQFGPAYDDYCRQVPRWLPRLRRR